MSSFMYIYVMFPMIKVRICSGLHELNQPRVVEQKGKFFSLWDFPVEVHCGLTGVVGCH